jgi:hypothetical protein
LSDEDHGLHLNVVVSLVYDRNEAMSDPTTSGTLVIAFQKYVEELGGVDAFKRLTASMTPDDAAAFKGIILPQSRYSTVAYIHAFEAAGKLFGQENFGERYGEWAVKYSINVFFRFLLRFTKPTWVLDRGLRLWRTYHDSGEWDIQMTENTFHGVLRGFAVPSATYCRSIMGWMRGAGRMTGAGETHVEHRECRAAGAEQCVFDARWD